MGAVVKKTPWYPQAQNMDIAQCDYPRRENPDKPGGKPRPGLVLMILTDYESIIAVYGTSQIPALIEDWQLLVQAEPGTGLSKPTLFDFKRRAALPRSREYFPPQGKRSPRKGQLPQHYQNQIPACIVAADKKTRSGESNPAIPRTPEPPSGFALYLNAHNASPCLGFSSRPFP